MTEIGVEFVQYTVGDDNQKAAAENRILELRMRGWRATHMQTAVSADGKTCYVIVLMEAG